MKLVLMERELWGFVQGTETKPGDTAEAVAKNAFRLRSDKAYSLIALSVKGLTKPSRLSGLEWIEWDGVGWSGLEWLTWVRVG